MPLETGDKISDLVAANPTGDDGIRQGDNHLRLLKQILLNSVADTGDLIIGFLTRDAAVASTNLAVGKYVQTLGKTVPSDGQSGLYLVVAAGTGVADDLNFVDLVGSVGQLELIFLNETSNIAYERQIAVGGETVITTSNSYEIGTNSLQVFLNGIRQVTPTDYTEDSATQLTLTTPMLAGDTLDIYTLAVQVASISAASTVFVPAGNLASTDVQAALEELDSEKSNAGHTHPYLDENRNLSDVDNPATAFANIKQPATDTSTGVVERATQAEVDAGTDTSRYITPSTLANYQGLAGAATQRQVITASASRSFAGTTTLGVINFTVTGADLARSRLEGILKNVVLTAAADGSDDDLASTRVTFRIMDGASVVGSRVLTVEDRSAFSGSSVTVTEDVLFTAWPVTTVTNGLLTLTLQLVVERLGVGSAGGSVSISNQAVLSVFTA